MTWMNPKSKSRMNGYVKAMRVLEAVRRVAGGAQEY